MEMITMCRVYTIFHLSISMSLCWLAGNTHKLHECDWSFPKMGKSIDVLEEALIAIEKDTKKCLNEKFMISVFDSITAEVPDFADYRKYTLQEKTTPTMIKNESKLANYNEKEGCII